MKDSAFSSKIELSVINATWKLSLDSIYIQKIYLETWRYDEKKSRMAKMKQKKIFYRTRQFPTATVYEISIEFSGVEGTTRDYELVSEHMETYKLQIIIIIHIRRFQFRSALGLFRTNAPYKIRNFVTFN